MFLTIFVKKSFLFLVKKIFDGNFFIEITKKSKIWLYQMKVGIKLGKVKKFGIGWCIFHRMAADNAERGFVQTSPRIYLIGLRELVNFVEKKMDSRKVSCTPTDTRPKKFVRNSVQHRTGFWSYPGHFFNAIPDKV